MARLRVVLAGLLAVGGLGCNWIEVAFASAEIEEMIPGQNVGSGELDCWLVLRFDEYPKGIDPKQVRVRFASEALEQPAEFDWAFIARNDVVANGTAFGSGHRPNPNTRPDTVPPLNQELRVRFPLRAKTSVESSSSRLWLNAELFWGSKRQDSERRTLDHVYARTS